MSFNKGNIAWVDVETDSLDASTGHLLEIAVVVTDAELNILDEEGFHAVVRYTYDEALAMRSNAATFVQNMHDITALWIKCWQAPEALPLTQVDEELLEYLQQFGEPRTMPVAGNSVRLDMNFMDKHLPKTAGFLDYHMRDVSTVAGLASDWYNLPWFEKKSDHTAKLDIREAIRELKHYREAIFRPQWTDELQEFATRLATLGSQMREDENKVLIADAVERIFGGGPVSETIPVPVGRMPLESLPIPARDQYVAEVMKFLLERGYAFTAPGGVSETKRAELEYLIARHRVGPDKPNVRSAEDVELARKVIEWQEARSNNLGEALKEEE